MAQYLNNKYQRKPMIDKCLENITFGRSMDFILFSTYLLFFLCRPSSHIYSDNDLVIIPFTSKRITTIVFTYFQLRLRLDLFSILFFFLLQQYTKVHHVADSYSIHYYFFISYVTLLIYLYLLPQYRSLKESYFLQYDFLLIL